jgi:metal-dependent HD superfamily phosphatase/phosphodiesterase
VRQPASQHRAATPAEAPHRHRVAAEPPAAGETPLITLEDIQQDPLISTFLSNADRVMEGLGYTEHGFRHANLTARIAFNVLTRLGFGERLSLLGCLGGYLHDIGNMVARDGHGQAGALLAYEALKDRMPTSDLALIMAAVGGHEEEGGEAAGPVSAAVILADKTDVHRSRVRKSAQIDFDIHDRVNFAAEQSFLRVDSSARTLTLELRIDTEISQVMEYFEIFLQRMVMCRRAAETLDCRFKLTINGAALL